MYLLANNYETFTSKIILNPVSYKNLVVNFPGDLNISRPKYTEGINIVINMSRGYIFKVTKFQVYYW